MKQFIEHKWIIVGTILGGLAGLVYWKEVGCVTGTCPIKSNWQAMLPYGMVMGYLVSDFAAAIVKRK
jgi:hypothetical protein